MYKNIQKQITKAGRDKTISKAQLVLIRGELKEQIKQINKDIQDNIETNMHDTTKAVVMDTRKFLKQIGFEDVENAFFYVPDSIVKSIVTGQIYQPKWSLSKAIWGHTKGFNDKMDEIIAEGTKYGKSAYEISKDLEKYVNPNVVKKSRVIQSWRIDQATGKKIKDKFYFGNVDYNAQRLARTMVSHAYQQSFQQVCEHNPFVIGYRWDTSNFHGRICDICKERANTDKYGLGVGIFPKDKLPLDHPNGMCTFEAVIDDNLNNIALQVADWYNSPRGTYPDIDRYALDFLR